MANKIFKIYIQTILFFIFFLLIFSLCRIGFIIHSGVINNGIFSLGNTNSFPFLDFINTIFAGIRYDGRIVGSLTIVYIGLYILLILFNKIRYVTFIIYSFIISFLVVAATIVNDTYFFIYNDTFNIILLGAVFDDQTAIFHTAFNSNYNVPLKLFLIALISISFAFLYTKLYKKIENSEFKSNIKINIVTGLLLIYFIPFVTSSTLNLQGGDLYYLVNLPENNFFKKATPGAIHDLDRVNRVYNDIKGESFEKYAGGKSIQQVLESYFQDYNNQDNISRLMEKTVKFSNNKQADHIFLIIMESLSSYHISEEFNKSGINTSMYRLINSENGLKVPVFIQNGYGTIETLDLMVTGLYSTYFPVSEMTSKIPCFDSSTGKIFKDLGYETSFYYFGSSAWRKVGNYVLSQGFNQSYAMENMKNKKRSTWGIYDNEGFDFIYDDIKNHKGKTFNMILTTSNHPPYDINITDYNIDTKNIEKFLDEKYPQDKRYGGINSQILSVTAYSIESVVDFVEKTYAKYPKSLFIITGDHFDRIHPSPVRDIYTSTSIPLIMYGYGVKDVKLKYEAASHKDIVPTIVEMNAPLGFKYHSFGDSFITYDNNSLIDYERIAIGAQSIANGRFIYNGEKIEYFNGAKQNKNDINIAKEYINKLNNGKAISWYIVNKGYEINSP